MRFSLFQLSFVCLLLLYFALIECNFRSFKSTKIIRGQVNKSMTKVLVKKIFLSTTHFIQHFSNIFYSFQNARFVEVSKYVYVWEMISSLKSNLFPPNNFFRFGNKKWPFRTKSAGKGG